MSRFVRIYCNGEKLVVSDKEKKYHLLESSIVQGHYPIHLMKG